MLHISFSTFYIKNHITPSIRQMEYFHFCSIHLWHQGRHTCVQHQSSVVIVIQSLSHVRFLATPWTVALQVPLSMGFPRQEDWSGQPSPSPGYLPDPGIEPTSPALAGRFFTTEPRRKALQTTQGLVKEKLKHFPSFITYRFIVFYVLHLRETFKLFFDPSLKYQLLKSLHHKIYVLIFAMKIIMFPLSRILTLNYFLMSP